MKVDLLKRFENIVAKGEISRFLASKFSKSSASIFVVSGKELTKSCYIQTVDKFCFCFDCRFVSGIFSYMGQMCSTFFLIILL